MAAGRSRTRRAPVDLTAIRTRKRAPGPDRDMMRRGARLFLAGSGETGLKRDMKRTPERVAQAWSTEILAGYRSDARRILATSFRSPEDGMVLVSRISFVSVCVHHLLPFLGEAHVAYLPGGRLIGLSKIARTVDALARRLQLQERLGRQIVEVLDDALAPRGSACRLEAEHLCMSVRGARKRGSRVVTTSYSGVFQATPALRAEFLRLCGAPPPAETTPRRPRRSAARRHRRPARRGARRG